MATIGNTHDRTTIWLRRAARVWSLPIIIYALLLLAGYGWSWATTGVADPYAVPDTPLIEALPPILLLVASFGLALAWRREALGSAITLVFCLAAIIVLLVERPLTGGISPATTTPYLLTLIVAVPGILFLTCCRRAQRRQTG